MNGNQQHLLCLGFFLYVLVLSTGCSIPGSTGHVLKLNGQIDDYRAIEKPLEVKVLPPRLWGEIEGLDHLDSMIKMVIDADGDFVYSHSVAYNFAFFILPPLGKIPKTPPPNVYLVVFSDCPHEVYWVDYQRKDPHYRVYHMPQKEEIPHDKGRWTIFDASIKKVKLKNEFGRICDEYDIIMKFRRTR